MSVDPSRTNELLRLAKTGHHQDGQLSLDAISRIEGLLTDYSGKLDYSLAFSIDEFGYVIIDTEINCKLAMECQRCLEPFVFSVHKRNKLAVVNSKQEIAELDTEYEPLLLEEQDFNMDDLLVDELLLSIPIAPMHPLENCSGKETLSKFKADDKRKPFAVLAALKNDHK